MISSPLNSYIQLNPKKMKSDERHVLSNQTWTAETLCVESFHEHIPYFTSRWDGLCPYIDVSPEMLKMAKKPFIVYAIPPESPYGVPITDHYGLVDVSTQEFWQDELRQHKFKKLDKAFRQFQVKEEVISGRSLSCNDLFEMGKEHFDAYEIHDKEIAGFVDYVQNLDVLIIRVFAPNGELVLTDVSMLLPDRNQVYGSFCQWNLAHKNRSPGIYACLLVCRWAHRNGYRFYNLGPVGDYPYKSLFVTELEPIYAIALTDYNHPLALDDSSPLHTDFDPRAWNQILRNQAATESVELDLNRIHESLQS